jgi:hypothetical protein
MFYVLEHTNNFQQQHTHKMDKCSSDAISLFVFGSAPILQTLGLIYEIQWASRQCDPVIGECPVGHSKKVRVGRSLWSRWSTWYQGVAMERSGNPLLNLGAR